MNGNAKGVGPLDVSCLGRFELRASARLLKTGVRMSGLVHVESYTTVQIRKQTVLSVRQKTVKIYSIKSQTVNVIEKCSKQNL